MFNLEREQSLEQKLLLDLKIRLQQLLCFIKENETCSKPYFCRFLEIMLHNMEIWVDGNYKDTDLSKKIGNILMMHILESQSMECGVLILKHEKT